MATADKVREYALITFIKPARNRGDKTVTFTATDIHKGMALQERFPLVCSEIDTDKFLEYASVKLVNREGPKQRFESAWGHFL